jgi:hypothetical protein
MASTKCLQLSSTLLLRLRNSYSPSQLRMGLVIHMHGILKPGYGTNDHYAPSSRQGRLPVQYYIYPHHSLEHQLSLSIPGWLSVKINPIHRWWRDAQTVTQFYTKTKGTATFVVYVFVGRTTTVVGLVAA